MMSDYELARLRQIERNELVIEALGLRTRAPPPPPHPRPARARLSAERVRFSTRARARASYAELHLFGRDLKAWPLPLPPVYCRLRARMLAEPAPLNAPASKPDTARSRPTGPSDVRRTTEEHGVSGGAQPP